MCLGKSKLFNACFNRKTAPKNAARLTNLVLGKMASDQKWDRNTASKVRNNCVKAVMGVPQGSDTGVYANVLSDTLSNELGSSGQINDDNLNQMGPDMASNFLLGVSGAAPKMGMQLGGIDINSDLDNARNQMSLSMRSPGMDVSAGMPGMDVSAGAPGADIDMYGGAPGMQARVGAPQRFGSALKLGFGKSKLFNACFNTKTSPRNAARLANIVIGKMASDQKWDRDTASKVKNASVKALMGVPQGSDTNVYAKVLSDALSTELGSSGQINDDNLNQMGPDMAGNFLLGVSGTAPKMGMQLGGIDINSDLSNLRTQMSSSMRAPGMDVSAGMPGMDVGAEMPGTDVSAEMPGMDVGAETPGMDVSAGMPGMDVGAEMPGMDVSAGMPGMDVSAGAPGADVDMYGEAPGMQARVGAPKRFGSGLKMCLGKSKLFNACFNRKTAPKNAARLTNLVLGKMASDQKWDRNTASKVRNNCVKAVMGVPQGSDTGVYANVLSDTLSNELGSSGQINDDNLNQMGPDMASNFLLGVSGAAPKMGMQLGGIDINSDLDNARNQMSLSMRSPGMDVSAGMPGMDVSAGAPGADIDMYGGAPGMQARVGAPQRFGSALKLGFGKSKLFNACFNTKTSPRNAARLANIVIGKMASDQKWDRDTASKVKNASVKALMGVPQGSDTNVYAKVLSDALSTELGSSGQINDDNLNQMGPDMAGNFLLGVSGTAPKMGMQLGGIDINSDLSNLRTQMSSSMRAPGMDVSAGMPGMDVGAEMPGTDVSAEMPGMDVSAGMPGMDVSAGMPGMDVGAEMPGMDVSAGMPGMDVSAGMPGVDATAGIPGLGKLLDSTGLKSPQALNRITGLASGLLQAVGPNGINVGKLAGMLQGNINNLVKTGVSKGEATVETVVELMASTLQLLKSVPLLGNVDLSSLTKDLSSTTKAVSSVVSLLANI